MADRRSSNQRQLVVIAGTDEVALRIAEKLMGDHEVMIVVERESETHRLERLDVAVVHGSATLVDTLREAGISAAAYFVASLGSDERNIVACIAAGRAGAGHTICMLTRRGFFPIEADDLELAASLGIDTVVRPSENLADEIVSIVAVPGALDVRSFANGRVQLLKFEVESDSPLTRQPLAKVVLPQELLLVMGQRDEAYFVPKGLTRFEPGDRVTAMGTRRGIRRLVDYLHKRRRRKQVFVIGGGMVGFAAAKKLTESGWDVRLIEKDADRCDEVAAALSCLVLHGDGTDLALLEEEQVAEASALIAVTDNDERNLLVSLLARHLGVPRIVTRADRLINEKIFEKVGVDVVLSAHGAAIRFVVRDLVQHDTVALAELEHGYFHVLDIELPADFPDRTLLELQPPVIVGALLRDRRTVIPRGDVRLKPGDNLLVFCEADQVEQAQSFFSGTGERERRAKAEARRTRG